MISSTIFNPRKKRNVVAGLSLVSLMDIFTILVFFLLLNSGEAQKIENAKFVQLPDSTKGQTPHEELMILVNQNELWVGKEKLMDITPETIKSSEQVIDLLAEKLKEHTEKLGDLTPFQEKNGLAVIISGDKQVPYIMLKSIMATCRMHNYRNISLAVNRIVGASSRFDSAATAGSGGN